MKTLLSWFKPVSSQSLEEEVAERKATWVELFYDVSYVAVIAELASLLGNNVSASGIALYILLYIPIWWLWIGSTLFADRFDNDSKNDRLFLFLHMIPLAGLAVAIHHNLLHDGVHYALWYIVARILLTIRWWHAGRERPEWQPVTRAYTRGFLLAIAMWVLSVFIPAPYRYVVWLLALAIEFITPFSTLQYQAKHLPRLSDSHLTERFGLFTIIVLAEVFIGTVHGISSAPVATWQAMLVAGCGFFIAFCLWSIYFDDVIGHPRLPSHPWSVLWIYSHLPLTLSITSIGASIVYIAGQPIQSVLPAIQFIMVFSVASALFWIGIIEYAHHQGVPHDEFEQHNHICIRLRMLGVLLAIIVAVLSLVVSAFITIVLLLAILLHQVFKGAAIRG